MLQSVTIRRAGAHVILINNELHLGLELTSWEHADDFAQSVRFMARKFDSGAREQISPLVAVKREDEDVLIEYDNKPFLLVSCAFALELSNKIIGVARTIEEEAKAEDIAFDEALLLRSGVNLPSGLTNHPGIMDEAGKEAAWNRELRRAISGGVRAKDHIGVPQVRKQASE